MPNTKPARILAIDPGTREMGVAVLEKDELVYHGVQTIRSHRSPDAILKQARRIILRLISDFRPAILAYEKTFFARNRNTALLNVLGDEIRDIGRRQGLRVLGFAPSTVKKAVCGNGGAGKEEVARAVAIHYPELKVYLGQDRLWKARHHSNRFDAVALGLVARKSKAPTSSRGFAASSFAAKRHTKIGTEPNFFY